MNKLEVQLILDEQLAIFARQSHEDIAKLVNVPKSIAVQAPSGTKFQISSTSFTIQTNEAICVSLDQLMTAAGERLCH